MVTLKCLECSKEFEAQRSSAKFCSTKCRVDYNRKGGEVGIEIKPLCEVLPKEETTTFQGFVELVNPQPEPTIAQTPEKIVLPKAKGIMMGSDYLAALPKTTFQNLLIEFNSLVEDLPPIKKIEDKLYDLILQAQNSDLTARQAEAIRDRCIYYLKGQYSGQKAKN